MPLLANMVGGGAILITGADDVQTQGFSMAIFPGGIVRASAKTAQAHCQSLRSNGSNLPFPSRMSNFKGLNAVIGTGEILEKGALYDAKD